MTVGELAQQVGLRPSAVRYYERLGLIPPPPRRSGKRDYGPDAPAHLAVVRFAQDCGFTLAETRQLARGFGRRGAASAPWRALADAKLDEMDALIARAAAMKRLLTRIRGCRCATLEECGRRLRPYLSASPLSRPSASLADRAEHPLSRSHRTPARGAARLTRRS